VPIPITAFESVTSDAYC